MEAILDKLLEVLFNQYGILGIILLIAAYWIYYLVTKIIKDKDGQIKSLAAENREYRERFTQLMDTQFEFSKDETHDQEPKLKLKAKIKKQK